MSSFTPTSSFQVPVSGLDTPATFFQILSVQSLHYLTLSIFIPPFLAILSSNTQSLNFEGGPAQVGMILDWREVSARKTFDWSPLGSDWLSWRKGETKERLEAGLDVGDREAAKYWKAGSVWLGDTDEHDHAAGSQPVLIDESRVIRPGQLNGAKNQADLLADQALEQEMKAEIGDTGGSKAETDLEQWEWKITRDPSRGWAIAGAWAVACAVDVFLLTTVVRRPKHILDHVATLHLVHLLLTSWYSSSIPTSLFWWGVMIAHAVGCILWAERAAIGREMRTSVGQGLVGTGREQEEARLAAANDADSSNVGRGRSSSGPHVLFDEGAFEDDDGDEDEQSQMIKKPLGSSNGKVPKVERIEMKPIRK